LKKARFSKIPEFVLLFCIFGTDQCWKVFSAVGVAPDVIGDVQVGQLDVSVGRADDVGGGVDARLPLASRDRRRTARSQGAPHHRRGPRQHFILFCPQEGALLMQHRLTLNDNCRPSVN